MERLLETNQKTYVMKCPYNKEIICAYLENMASDMVYECADCPHYNIVVPKPEEQQVRIEEKNIPLLVFIAAVCCAILFMTIFCAFCYVVFKFIQWIIIYLQ